MASLPDYRDNAEAYELEERSRPDEMLMLEEARRWAGQHLNTCDAAAVLDLCCGTGLSMETLVDHPNVSLVVGVDVSEQYLAFARNRFRDARVVPTLLCGDAVDTSLPSRSFDLIMLASAYHHIDDSRKRPFLANVSRLLKSSGRVIIAENILPHYTLEDPASYGQAVKRFYREVLRTAKRAAGRLDSHVEGLIRRVAQYGLDGEYEFKVCWRLFEDDVHASRLRVLRQSRVWPDPTIHLDQGGNYVLELDHRAG